MIEANSNNQEFRESHDPQFYIEKLPSLEKRVQTLHEELKKTLTYIAPSDFYDRLDQAIYSEQIDKEWIENFKDIVAWKIEGRVNVPLMRLAENFIREFGGQTIFWLDTICDFAQNEKYDDNLRIWQVFDAYKNYLHLSIGEYEKNRKFRRLAKSDLPVTKKLISLINELNVVKQDESTLKSTFEDLRPKIQENYKSHETSNRKLVEFLKNEDEKNKNLDFFESGNPIYAVGKRPSEFQASNSKSRKIFKEQNVYKQKMITDFSVQMGQDKNRQLLNKIVGRNERLLDQEKVDELEKYFYSMQDKNSSQNIQNLRNQFVQSKSKLLSKSQTLYTNIITRYTIIEYYDFPIFPQDLTFKKFNNPFQQSELIDYDCTQYELYDEYKAEEVDIDESDSQEDSDDDSLDEIQKMEFYIEDNDGYDMDEEDRQVQVIAFRVGKEFGGNQWIFNHKEEEPFWINQRHLKSQKKRPNEDSQESESQVPYLLLNEDMKNDMIQSFYQETVVFIPNTIPMSMDVENEKPSKQIELTEEEIERLKKIFHGKTHHQGMDIINADQNLAQQFSKAKIKVFTSKLSKKCIKTEDGRKIFVYFVKENKENQLEGQNVENNNQEIDVDEDSETDFDELQTSPNDPEYRPSRGVKIHYDSKSRSTSQRISNQKSFSEKVQQQSKSQSSSLSNFLVNVTASNENSQNSKKSASNKSKQSHCESLASSNMTRLRPRNSRPNYNLNKILATPKTEKKEEKDIEI